MMFEFAGLCAENFFEFAAGRSGRAPLWRSLCWDRSLAAPPRSAESPSVHDLNAVRPPVRPPLRVCSTCVHRAALAGSTRAPSSHTHRRPRKLRLRCAATDQQRQAQDKHRRPGSRIAERDVPASLRALTSDMFAVLYITAEERANGEQRRTRRAAGRHSEAPPHLPRSRREPRHGALEDQYRQRVSHTHPERTSCPLARRGRGPHTLDRHQHNHHQATHHKSRQASLQI